MSSTSPVGTWVKETSLGGRFITTLHSDGTLTERSPDALDDTWAGSWREVSADQVEVTIGPYRSILSPSPDGGWNGPEFEDGRPNGEIRLQGTPPGGGSGDGTKEMRSFVRSTLAGQAQLEGVEDDIVEKLVENLASQLEDRILRQLIDALDEQQFAQFERLVEAEQVTQLETYFIEAGVPVQQIVTGVMADFAEEYRST